MDTPGFIRADIVDNSPNLIEKRFGDKEHSKLEAYLTQLPYRETDA